MLRKIAIVKFLTVFNILFMPQLTFSQWNNDAGLIQSYTSNAKVMVSSGTNYMAITDGNLQSYWESASPLPSNYVSEKKLNIFLDKDKYEISGGSSSLNNVFDGILSSKANINSGILGIRFSIPQDLFLLSVKIKTTDTVTIYIQSAKGILEFSYFPSENYSLKAMELLNNEKVQSIKFNCKSPFEVFEVAALYSYPTQEVIFDFGEPKSIGWISSRHFNGKGVISIAIQASNNNIIWNDITTLNPLSTAYIPLLIKPHITARYIKVLFTLVPKDYQKAKLLEFNVWDKFGPYGMPLPAKVSKNTYSKSFGINAIWGWGYSVYSDQLPTVNGPGLFSKVAHLARNYHSINWDIEKPGDNPNYENMVLGEGTSATSWLNWNREYELWKLKGFDIDACIMFNNKNFADSLWSNTKSDAMAYGKQFANHFSRTSSLISMVEIGNEPWNYSKQTYRNILEGMSLGLRQSSQNLIVLPCAIQAYEPNNNLDNYISDYIDNTNSANINGLNTHVYSYVFNQNGGQVAVNPEDPRSEVWSITNLQRFAKINMDNMPIYVTEFGYDSDGGGEDCTHDVCVTEFEQAIFGTRMALILYRLGAKQFYWYYFANVDYNSMKHNRSGLTSSYSKGMQQKQSFEAFELLQNTIGDYYFHHIIMENDSAYVYAFSDSSGKITRIIAWRPTSYNHNKSEWVSFPFNNVIDKVIPLANITNNSSEVSYVKGVNELKISLSGVPVVIIIKD